MGREHKSASISNNYDLREDIKEEEDGTIAMKLPLP